MKSTLIVCALALMVTWTGVVFGQSGVEAPADIHPDTGNRLAPLTRDELDAEGQRAYDLRSVDGVLPPRGTRNATAYSPIVAEGIHVLGRLASGSSRLGDSGLVGGGVLTPAQAELAILLAGWEIESKVVWTSHEPDAIAAGVPQDVVDAVKFDRSLDEITGEYAAIIRFARQLYRDHRVDSDVYSEFVEIVGERGMVEFVGLMGRYVTLGTLMNAVDQQLSSPNRLPER